MFRAKEAYHILPGHQQTIVMEAQPPHNAQPTLYCFGSILLNNHIAAARTIEL
jgi:hypothetical protein